MANLPWKSNVGGPSDEELNRVVQAHVEQRRGEVTKLVADAEVYEHRLAERGSRTYTFWGKGRHRGKLLANVTPRHTASAAVNEGSIKALTTNAVPENPSIAWLRRVDKNAAIDQGRQVTAHKQKLKHVHDSQPGKGRRVAPKGVPDKVEEGSLWFRGVDPSKK